MDEMPLFQQATLVELSRFGKSTAELKIFPGTHPAMSVIASDLQARSTIGEAHSIKSSSATFGFVELSRLARELESGAEA